MTPDSSVRGRRVIFAHPSADLYGSDLQLIESVAALRAAGAQCTVVLPQPGPLVPRLVVAGAHVETVDFPVLRKEFLHPVRFVRLIPQAFGSSVRLLQLLRRLRPDVVYVNTMSIPVWAILAKLARLRSVIHVHEAENTLPRILKVLLALPVLAGNAVITNSEAARRELISAVPLLARRTSVIYNGVPDNGALPDHARDAHDPIILALVGRLSPRKGIDVAVEAAAILRDQGRDLRLLLCGSIFPGYEWYEEQLQTQVSERRLQDTVHFRGYVERPAEVLLSSHIVLVPSRTEPFGNVTVEAMLAQRPVIASDIQGPAEIVRDGVTGMLVPPNDPRALANAIARLADDPEFGAALAANGRRDAVARFGVARYAGEIVSALFPGHTAATASAIATRSDEAPGRRPASPA